MDLTFVIAMSVITYLLWKAGQRLVSGFVGVASVCAVLPDLPGQAAQTLAATAGIPNLGAALNAGMTLAIAILAILVMFGSSLRGR